MMILQPLEKHRLYDSIIRDGAFILRYYLPFSFQKVESRYVLMADGKIPHGGMFDRLKGAISIYAIAKSLHKEFKIYFTHPFDLRTYLQPNSYDWTIDRQQLLFRYPAARPVRAYGEFQNPSRLWKNRNGEAHFYYGYNSLDKINAHFGTHYEWGALYRELFKPTPALQKLIDKYRQDIGGPYVVAHLRFLNLLGDKTETAINPELPSPDKQRLMQRCYEQVATLMRGEGVKLMLATDSMTFINYAQRQNKNIYVVPGTVRHIDTAGVTQEDENLKMFVDYHLIAGASHVYNIVAGGMWPSAFSEYPAMIGHVPFERIRI